jgi:hypothetical protein
MSAIGSSLDCLMREALKKRRFAAAAFGVEDRQLGGDLGAAATNDCQVESRL